MSRNEVTDADQIESALERVEDAIVDLASSLPTSVDIHDTFANTALKSLMERPAFQSAYEFSAEKLAALAWDVADKMMLERARRKK